MGLMSWFEEKKQILKERRIEKLNEKAASLEEGKTYDLLFLYKKGFVRAKGNGQTITNIYANIESLIQKELCVVVKPGTYFMSKGNYQNMATTAEYTFRLGPCDTRHMKISAACINAGLPIPGEDDKFQGVAMVSKPVARFLEASKGEDPMVIQAGVWTLTDNYTRDEVTSRLVTRDRRGNASQAITNDHCDRARAILNKLKIPNGFNTSNVEYEKKTVEYGDGTYTGEFRYGEWHGVGKFTTKSGDSYEGEWRDGLKHGHGKQFFVEGCKNYAVVSRDNEIIDADIIKGKHPRERRSKDDTSLCQKCGSLLKSKRALQCMCCGFKWFKCENCGADWRRGKNICSECQSHLRDIAKE